MALLIGDTTPFLVDTLSPPSLIGNNSFFGSREKMPILGDCIQAATYAAQKACSDTLLLDFIYDRLQRPPVAKTACGRFVAVVSFTIEEDGTMSAIKLVRDPDYGFGEEAMRVVRLLATEGPKWTAGRQMEIPIRVQYNLPIIFN